MAAITVSPMPSGATKASTAIHLRRFKTPRSQSNVSDMVIHVESGFERHGSVTWGKTRTTPEPISTCLLNSGHCGLNGGCLEQTFTGRGSAAVPRAYVVWDRTVKWTVA